jgi:hypothetical protein
MVLFGIWRERNGNMYTGNKRAKKSERPKGEGEMKGYRVGTWSGQRVEK